MTSLEHVHNEIRGLLRAKGLRATTPRIAVLTVLHERRAPMTHEQIMDTLSDRAFDKATVWRLLSELSTVSIVRRMDLGDRVWRYELLDACRSVTSEHPHFLCGSCHHVFCLPELNVTSNDGVLPSVLEGASFQVRIEGTCKECVSAA